MLCTCVWTLFTTTILAQEQVHSFYAGAFIGVSLYNGDLVDQPIEQIAETHPAFGAYLRFNYGKYFSARLTGTYGRVSGKDSNSSKLWRRTRNLRFRSPVLEMALIPEINIYEIELPEKHYKIIPYAFAGIGGFWFNPQAPSPDNMNEWVNLQPQGTEGQGLPGNEDLYSRIAISIPNGIGVKFQIGDYTTFTWETGIRITLTDYLDDVHHLYPDFEQLRDLRGEIAVGLSDRTMEYTGVPSTVQPGDTRSNGELNDVFIFSGFSVSINLSPKAKP